MNRSPFSQSQFMKRVPCGSYAFRQFIRAELFPEIRRRYRTTNERSIIGESLAGLFIVETLLVDETMVTHYIALDPSLWWNSYAMADSANRSIATFDAVPRSLFIATSKEPSTSVPSTTIVAFMQVSAPKTFRVTYDERADLEHFNIFRPSSVRRLSTRYAEFRDISHKGIVRWL